MLIPYSLGFRKWARKICPEIDRFTALLDRLECQRQRHGSVNAYIDLAKLQPANTRPALQRLSIDYR